jgi:hypothetical protein
MKQINVIRIQNIVYVLGQKLNYQYHHQVKPKKSYATGKLPVLCAAQEHSYQQHPNRSESKTLGCLPPCYGQYIMHFLRH